ncbi:MAG TPA: DUF2851 family protein [Chthoniobacteraceae bacterium]|jgi:hypothetical protein|nr:DUF2851 family protein [Chthoniobacteraceae bacterium]
MKLAGHYEAIRPAGSSVRDEWFPEPPGEIELQARWFSGEFGREFKTVDGRAARIIQFGVWNREAGPDFAEAAISIDGGEPLRGAIELDLDARDWERHGHATNPAYEGVVLHVYFQSGEAAAFARTVSNRGVPQVRLDLRAIAGPPPNPVPAATPGRCVAPLSGLDLPTVRGVLEGAAQYRLRRKAARLARLRETRGDDEALYQALAETLGYKSNKLPFALLSQRTSVRALRRMERIDALLFGVAGFLKPEDFPGAAPVTKAYLRELWEGWWAMRAEWEHLTVPPELWKTGGQRPVNHPQRRLAALAAMVRQWPKVREAAAACDTAKLRKLLTALHDEYWEHHYTVRSDAAARPMALVGKDRFNAMFANVFVPWAILDHPEKWEEYRALNADLSNRRVEVAAMRLFAGDPRQSDLLKSAAMQQGLLQIYEDFCMQDESDCAACPFPRQLGQWRT